MLLSPRCFDRCDIIKRLRRLLLKGSRRIHRSKRCRAIVLWCFLHLCFRVRWNPDNLVLDHISANLIQVFCDVRDQLFRGRMFLLDFFEYFSRRFVCIDDFGGICKNLLLLFQLSESDFQDFFRRQIDQLRFRQPSLITRCAQAECQCCSWQSFSLEPRGKVAQRVGRLAIRVQKIASHLLVFHGIDGCHHVLSQKIGGTASDLDGEFDVWLR